MAGTVEEMGFLRGSTSSQVFLLASATFFFNASFNMINAVIALYATEEIHAGVGEVGLVVGAFFASSSLFKIPTGMAISPGNTVRWMLLGFVLITVSPIAYVLAPSVPALVALRLVNGFGFTVTVTTLLTAVSLVTPAGGQARSIAMYTVGAATGLAVGPGLTTLALSLGGLRSAVILAGLVNLPCFGVWLRLRSHWMETGSSGPPPPSRRFLLSTLRETRVLSIALIYLAFNAVAAMIMTLAPLQARTTFEMSDQHWSLLFFGYSLLLLFVRMVLTRVVSERILIPLTLLGLVNASLASLGMAFSADPLVFSAFLVSGGISHGVGFPLSAIMAVSRVRTERLVFTNSAYLLGGDVGSFLGPVMASAIASEYGIPWGITAIGLFPVPGVFLAIAQGRKQGTRLQSAKP